jgi:tetratricopeptide (TPR) repeat protein
MASTYLEKGEVDKALSLCLAGRREFPRYITGSLILGKCYEALGRREEALVEYERVLDGLPGNTLLADLRSHLRDQEEDEFREYLSRRHSTIRDKGGSVPLERYLASPASSGQESGVDFLLKQLREVQRVAPTASEKEAGREFREAAAGGGTIVTATLAEIYASQKEYGEAIRAYKRLAEQQPADAGRYRARLLQLEELARAQESGKH